MAEKEMEAGVSVEWIETSEEPFKPKEKTEIFAVLEPKEEEQATYYPSDYLDFFDTIAPPTIPKYKSLPEFEAEKKELIINIESTAVNPWEGRVICIGVMDPNEAKPKAVNFIRETEEKTLEDFINFFKEGGYSELIGYHVAFDYRYLYVLMQKYRKAMPGWKDLDLNYLMQQQKQVKQEYVFNYLKTGKLDDWAKYLAGIKPPATQKDVYEFYKKGELDKVADYNTYKLTVAYYLWVLNKLVNGEIPTGKSYTTPTKASEKTEEGMPLGSSSGETEMVEVICPNCMQTQEMPKTKKTIKCMVCDSSIPNPEL